ncbi:hypothetical protein ACWF94_22030, partial [Streptomyces sp. NPDC055078]
AFCIMPDDRNERAAAFYRRFGFLESGSFVYEPGDWAGGIWSWRSGAGRAAVCLLPDAGIDG